jgi:CRISPR type IV-associated protein Csf1
MQFPSEVVEKALGLVPDKTLPTWKHLQDGHCSHCAAPISQGTFYSKVAIGEFFSDTRDLAAFTGIVCWRCVHLRTKVLLNGLGQTVCTADGVYSISKDTEKAWLFLDPPEPPFVAVHTSSTMQHLVWRTPVTLSKERISIRFGESLFVVRPAVLRKVIELAEAVQVRNAGQWIPLLHLDRKAKAAYHGRINAKAAELMTDEELEFLKSNVGAGERWALSYICHSKKPQPLKPEPKTEKVLANLQGKSE